MKKVLIITPVFAPRNYVTAIRTTKLAKYLKLFAGYNITVITDEFGENDIVDPILNNELKYVDKLINLSYTRTPYNFIKKQNFSKQLVKYIKKTQDSYDVVISTSPPPSVHVAAVNIKKRNPNAIWISDFRDPINKHSTKKDKDVYLKYFSKKALVNPDIITAISEGCLVDVEIGANVKTHIIYNGYDRDDLTNIVPSPNEKFSLTYAGKLYNRDLSVVFQAISELINEGKINKSKVQINYVGRQDDLFKQQIAQYDIADIVSCHGFIDRSKSLELQMSSDILLLASWNNTDQTGIITGKFYEYLMIEKPIVCTIVGNLPNSELRQMMEAANAGIVWEEPGGDADYPKLKSYILDQYDRFTRNEPLLFEPNRKYIEQFDYKNIAQHVIRLIEGN